MKKIFIIILLISSFGAFANNSYLKYYDNKTLLYLDKDYQEVLNRKAGESAGEFSFSYSSYRFWKEYNFLNDIYRNQFEMILSKPVKKIIIAKPSVKEKTVSPEAGIAAFATYMTFVGLVNLTDNDMFNDDAFKKYAKGHF